MSASIGAIIGGLLGGCVVGLMILLSEVSKIVRILERIERELQSK